MGDVSVDNNQVRSGTSDEEEVSENVMDIDDAEIKQDVHRLKILKRLTHRS